MLLVENIIIIIIIIIIMNIHEAHKSKKSALGVLHVKIPTYINRHIQENKIN